MNCTDNDNFVSDSPNQSNTGPEGMTHPKQFSPQIIWHTHITFCIFSLRTTQTWTVMCRTNLSKVEGYICNIPLRTENPFQEQAPVLPAWSPLSCVTFLNRCQERLMFVSQDDNLTLSLNLARKNIKIPTRISSLSVFWQLKVLFHHHLATFNFGERFCFQNEDFFVYYLQHLYFTILPMCSSWQTAVLLPILNPQQPCKGFSLFITECCTI